MRALLFAGLTFVLSCCVISGVMSVLLALVTRLATGVGAVPQPYHVLIGVLIGGFVAIFPAAVVAWLVSRRVTV